MLRCVYILVSSFISFQFRLRQQSLSHVLPLPEVTQTPRWPSLSSTPPLPHSRAPPNPLARATLPFTPSHPPHPYALRSPLSHPIVASRFHSGQSRSIAFRQDDSTLGPPHRCCPIAWEQTMSQPSLRDPYVCYNFR